VEEATERIPSAIEVKAAVIVERRSVTEPEAGSNNGVVLGVVTVRGETSVCVVRENKGEEVEEESSEELAD
jgi:hypothetical protein